MMMDGKMGGARKLDREDLSAVAGGSAAAAELHGTFASVNGTNLNLSVDWQAEGVSGSRLLTVNVFANCYSLDVASFQNAVELQVNGVKYYADSASVSGGNNNELSRLPLASFRNIPVSGNSAYMIVTWRFNGMYSGQPIDNLVATGMATL